MKGLAQMPVGPYLPATCHRREPNLPKRHTQTDLDVKEITSENCNSTVPERVIFFFFFSHSLRVLLPGLLFDHPPSLLFFFLSSLSFYLSIFSLFNPSFLVLLVLIL
jgi:hypothetical protein